MREEEAESKNDIKLPAVVAGEGFELTGLNNRQTYKTYSKFRVTEAPRSKSVERGTKRHITQAEGIFPTREQSNKWRREMDPFGGTMMTNITRQSKANRRTFSSNAQREERKHGDYSFGNGIYGIYNTIGGVPNPYETRKKHIADTNTVMRTKINLYAKSVLANNNSLNTRSLIEQAVGSKPMLMSRNFISCRGRTYEEQIRRELNSEQFDLMKTFMDKGILDTNSHHLGTNNELALNSYKKARKKINNVKILKEKIKVDKFNYREIMKVYDSNLIENNIEDTGEEYWEKKHQEARGLLIRLKHRKQEEQSITTQLYQPSEFAKSNPQLKNKLSIAKIAINQFKNRIEKLLINAPFSLEEITSEIEDIEEQRGVKKEIIGNKISEIGKGKQDIMFIDDQQARYARDVLLINVIEARAIQNRLGCETISDLVILYREVISEHKESSMLALLVEALVNKEKAEKLMNFFKKIVDFEEEKARQEKGEGMEEVEKHYLGEEYTDYKSINLNISPEMRDQLKTKELKVVYLFLPFLSTNITAPTTVGAKVRSLLYLEEEEAWELNTFTLLTSIYSYIQFHRHNRHQNEYGVMSNSDFHYFVKNKNLPREKLENFIRTIFILAKETLLIRPQVLQLGLEEAGVISSRESINLSGVEMTVPSITGVVATIINQYMRILQLDLSGCNINDEIASCMKILLSNSDIQLVHLNMNNNVLHDMGADHIIQASKSNTNSRLKILEINKNSVTAQCGIRLAHVLKYNKTGTGFVGNLQMLCVVHNSLGNIGAESIANFIKNNQSLKYLDISYNLISDRGFIALTAVFAINTGLLAFNCIGNEIGEDSVSSLGNCLQNNKVTKLCFMKLGELQCREQTFIKLIQRGLSTCLNLKYLYLISPQHFKNEIISHTNSSFLPKILYCTDMTDTKYYNRGLTDILVRYILKGIWRSQTDEEDKGKNKMGITKSTLYSNKSKTQSSFIKTQYSETSATGGAIHSSKSIAKEGEKVLEEIIKGQHKEGREEIIIHLLTEIFPADYYLPTYFTPFHTFALKGLTHYLVFCLKLGFSPDLPTSIANEAFPSCTALHIASHMGHLETCERLISNGADVECKDINSDTPMHYAASAGKMEILQLLIPAKEGLLGLRNRGGRLPLHCAIKPSNTLELFRFLSSRTDETVAEARKVGGYYNLLGEQGFTPLMISIKEDHLPIFRFLIQQAIYLDETDNSGRTALHVALLCKREVMADILIKKECNINQKDTNGESPLMYACRSGLLDSLRHIHMQGGNIYQLTKKGDTLLHLAAAIDRGDIIGYLIDRGLDVGVPNNQGVFPRDLCSREEVKNMMTGGNHQYYDLYNQNEVPGKHHIMNKPGFLGAGEEGEVGMKNMYVTGMEMTGESWYEVANEAFKDTDIYTDQTKILPLNGTIAPQYKKDLNVFLNLNAENTELEVRKEKITQLQGGLPQADSRFGDIPPNPANNYTSPQKFYPQIPNRIFPNKALLPPVKESEFLAHTVAQQRNVENEKKNVYPGFLIGAQLTKGIKTGATGFNAYNPRPPGTYRNESYTRKKYVNDTKSPFI